MSDLAALARQWASARRSVAPAIAEPAPTVVVEPEPPTRAEEPTSDARQDGIRKMPRPMAFKTWPKGTARLQKMSTENADRLWSAVKAGNLEAEAAIIRDNPGLVWSPAMRASKGRNAQNMTIEDLVGHGTVGLLNAVRTFEPLRGFTLSTWASYGIKHSIWRAINNEGNVVRIPIHVSEGRHGKRENDDRIVIAARNARRLLEFDAPTFTKEGDDGSLHDVIASDGPLQDELVGELRRDGLLNNLKLLDARTEDVVQRSVIEDETLESIGTTYGLTRQRIVQLRDAGLKKLATLDTIREYGEK